VSAVLRDEPPPLHVPVALDRIVRRCLQKLVRLDDHQALVVDAPFGLLEDVFSWFRKQNSTTC
jgi:hypothetical protein